MLQPQPIIAAKPRKTQNFYGQKVFAHGQGYVPNISETGYSGSLLRVNHDKVFQTKETQK